MNLGEFLSSIPNSAISGALLVILGVLVFFFIKYNVLVLSFIAGVRNKFLSFISRKIGKGVNIANKQFKRTAFLNQERFLFKIYRYFDDIIVNSNLTKDGVTVMGLLIFIGFLSLLITIGATLFFNLGGLAIVTFIIIFVFITVIFRFNSLSKVEHREAIIMDAVDLMVSDVKGGVFNAIVRYMDSFHPDIRPYFLECVDNVRNRGLGFKQSMLILNDRLGYSFSDFCQKAIIYEEKADDTLDDIFSSILERNRQRRLLRARNNAAFRSIMTTLEVSYVAIAGFAIFTLTTEPTIFDFIINHPVGKLMILGDILLFAVVMGYLSGLRAKSL